MSISDDLVALREKVEAEADVEQAALLLVDGLLELMRGTLNRSVEPHHRVSQFEQLVGELDQAKGPLAAAVAAELEPEAEDPMVPGEIISSEDNYPPNPLPGDADPAK